MEKELEALTALIIPEKTFAAYYETVYEKKFEGSVETAATAEERKLTQVFPFLYLRDGAAEADYDNLSEKGYQISDIDDVTVKYLLSANSPLYHCFSVTYLFKNCSAPLTSRFDFTKEYLSYIKLPEV